MLRYGRTLELPTLGDLLEGSGLTLNGAAAILRATHGLLFRSAPKDRLANWDEEHLARLISTAEQIALLNDPDVLAIGDRCPEQVACYVLALERTIPRAREYGLDLATLSALQRIRAILVEIQIVIRPTSVGLS